MTHSPARPPIKIGIAGLGLAGSLMIPAIGAHPAFTLTGVAEPNGELRRRFSSDFDCKAFSSAAELIADDEIDALYVATPHQFHREHAVAAADAGKHVLVEKPMALTLEDCDAMIDASDRAGVRLVVGHSHGFDPAVQTMRQIIASGRIGRVSMVQMFNYTDFLYRPRRPEELDTERGGGVLYNQLPHQIDIVRGLVGDDVATVFASMNRLDDHRATEGGVMAMLQFSDGASASIVYSGYDRFDSDELHGWISEGGRPKTPAHGRARAAVAARALAADEAAMRADMFGYGGTAWQSAPVADAVLGQPHFGTVIVSCEGGDLRQSPRGVVLYGDDGVEEIDLPAPRPGAGRAEVLDEFAQAIHSGDDVVHSGRFARETMRTCLAILQSARARTAIASTH